VDFSDCKHLEMIGNYAFDDCHALRRVTIPSTVNEFYGTTFLPLECIGVEGPMPLPSAIRLSVAYPNLTNTITLDQLLYLYSFQRIRPSDLLLPHYTTDRSDFSDDDDDDDLDEDEASSEPHTLWTDDQDKLKEIQGAYPEAIRRLVLWCIEKGVV
jgi:hypothetical protein